MPVKSFWNDDWLQAASARAFRDAAYGVKRKVASGTDNWPIKVAGPYFGQQLAGAKRGVKTGRGDTAVIKAGGLGPIKEKGAKPHTIEASAISGKRRRGGKRQALKFGGRYATRVQHPGFRAKPFMRPAAALFPGLYKSALARQLPRPKV